jgi:hypothetical protein
MSPSEPYEPTTDGRGIPALLKGLLVTNALDRGLLPMVDDVNSYKMKLRQRQFSVSAWGLWINEYMNTAN